MVAESRAMGFFPFSGFAIARPLKMRGPVRTRYLFSPYSVEACERGRDLSHSHIGPTRRRGL